MFKTVSLYSGRIWINRLDSMVGKAKNGRYFKKFRLLDNNKFYTLTVFSDKASNLFELPETLVVRNLPVYYSEYQQGDKTYIVYSTELKDLLNCVKK